MLQMKNNTITITQSLKTYQLQRTGSEFGGIPQKEWGSTEGTVLQFELI